MPVPGEARVDLAEASRRLDLPGRPVPPENWHLTLRFLGQVSPTVYERFLHGLEAIGAIDGFPIRMGSVGAFPNQRRATVVWIGVETGSQELAELAAIAEDAAVGAGLVAEERPFRPHLTLSRVRPPADAGAVVGSKMAVGWRCDRVVVYRSRHGNGGASYEPLETFALRR